MNINFLPKQRSQYHASFPLSVAKEYTRKVPHRQDGVIMKVLTKSYYIVIQERKIKRVGERERGNKITSTPTES